MIKLVMHRILVQDLEDMKLDPDTNKPICPVCDSLFDQCTCPKPWSRLDTDGWAIVFEEEELVAYPSEELYEGLSLWIFRNRDYLICGHCLQWIKAEWHWSDDMAEQAVETFYSIHKNCYDTLKKACNPPLLIVTYN